MALAAAAAIAAAAAVSVVAAAFALYALAEPSLGSAGAGAVVAAAAAALVGGAGLLARRKAQARRHAPQGAPDAGLVDKVIEIAKQRPMLAVGAAIAAGVYAIRHPSLVAAVIGAVMESRSRKA